MLSHPVLDRRRNDELVRAWRARWGSACPSPESLIDSHPDRRIRLDAAFDHGRAWPFHIDRAASRRRAYAILDDLNPSGSPLVALWSDDERPSTGDWRRQEGLCSADDHDDHPLMTFVDRAVDAERSRALIDDVLAGRHGLLLLAPQDLSWVMHPFGDGTEVIAASFESRLDLMASWEPWFCEHLEWVAPPGSRSSDILRGLGDR